MGLNSTRPAGRKLSFMKVCILQGSPRRRGNTAALLEPFVQRMTALGAVCETIRLYDLELKPCLACRMCQRDWTVFGCGQKDDMQTVFDAVLACDLLVLATPIYAWYCTPPMKCVLDRLVYGMNKYYGAEKGPSLWAGKSVALISTCGYPPEKGADLWELGMKRYCKHSLLCYRGMLAQRHLGYDTEFMDGEKAAAAAAFADELYAVCKEK